MLRNTNIYYINYLLIFCGYGESLCRPEQEAGFIVPGCPSSPGGNEDFQAKLWAQSWSLGVQQGSGTAQVQETLGAKV